MNEALQLIAEQQWLPLSALVIGAIVRALKSDTKLPVSIAPQHRPWLAFGLGLFVGFIELLIAGHALREAAVTAFGAPLLAILGHVVGVEVLRGGKEVPLPGLTRAPNDGGES